MKSIQTNENFLPKKALLLSSVTSVLDVAHTMIAEGNMGDWDSILAERQTSGRGQLRRLWESPSGNIYGAIRLPNTPPFSEMQAAPAVGALLASALVRLGVPCALKWPNDLVACASGQVEKFGGILLEERNNAVVAGIGINLMSFPDRERLRKDAAMAATSLCKMKSDGRLLGEIPSREKLWNILVSYAYSEYKEIRSNHNLWREKAESFLLWRGRNIEIDDSQGGIMQGILLGLGKNGGLRISCQTEEFFSGSLRLAVD